MTKTEKNTARLEYLHKLLVKYAHRWYVREQSESSRRMYDWVDEYNSIKAEDYDAWTAFCKKNGFSVYHDAMDNFD